MHYTQILYSGQMSSQVQRPHPNPLPQERESFDALVSFGISVRCTTLQIRNTGECTLQDRSPHPTLSPRRGSLSTTAFESFGISVPLHYTQIPKHRANVASQVERPHPNPLPQERESFRLQPSLVSGFPFRCTTLRNSETPGKCPFAGTSALTPTLSPRRGSLSTTAFVSFGISVPLHYTQIPKHRANVPFAGTERPHPNPLPQERESFDYSFRLVSGFPFVALH